jgi:hypothetical protein
LSDFTVLRLRVNTGTQGTPTWTAVPAYGAGTGQELRFSDSSAQAAVASASWPYMTRPGTTQNVPYAYVFTADSTGEGLLSGAGTTPTAFANGDYNQAEWDYDALGTFASAPRFTAYPTNAHGSVSRGDGSILGGHATDTGGTARSYFKGNMFGRVKSAGAPAAAPGTAPIVTAGTTGAVSPVAGANWLAAGQGDWQGLQGDNDWIVFPATPAATTADQIPVMFALFTGPTQNTGTHTWAISLKYEYA